MLPKKAQNRQNKIAKILISFILLLLVAVISFKSVELKEKRDNYLATKATLEDSIAYEKERAVSISEYETYTQTKAYVEEVARDKLGLVYEGEILFKDENQSN